MDQPVHAPETLNQPPLAFGEFVALIAALMALTALGIDSMLPALPAIGASLHVPTSNERQFVVTAFLIGFSVAQIAYGPLSDRFGRRPVLAGALAFYVVTNLVAAFAASFPLLLAARVASGAAVAGARVVTVALVRDCYAGRSMAQVMSVAMIIFFAAPILAPNFGALVLLVASWRMIFAGVALFAAGVFLWFVLRMPETLPAHARQSLDPGRVARDYLIVLRDRPAVGYTIASAALSGALFGFIGSVQQIVFDVFHAPTLLTLVFSCVAGTMALASLLNSRIVMRLGTRVISHSALAGLIATAGVHLILSLSGLEALWSFALLQALTMGCFGLATANFSAMAMEHMGAIAGTASSLQGFVVTLAGAVIGAVIGQAFDGTTVPLYSGFVLMGLLALTAVAIAERGRLFRPS